MLPVAYSVKVSVAVCTQTIAPFREKEDFSVVHALTQWHENGGKSSGVGGGGRGVDRQLDEALAAMVAEEHSFPKF